MEQVEHNHSGMAATLSQRPISRGSGGPGRNSLRMARCICAVGVATVRCSSPVYASGRRRANGTTGEA